MKCGKWNSQSFLWVVNLWGSDNLFSSKLFKSTNHKLKQYGLRYQRSTEDLSSGNYSTNLLNSSSLHPISLKYFVKHGIWLSWEICPPAMCFWIKALKVSNSSLYILFSKGIKCVFQFRFCPQLCKWTYIQHQNLNPS